jgi:hypothetical protein
MGSARVLPSLVGVFKLDDPSYFWDGFARGFDDRVDYFLAIHESSPECVCELTCCVLNLTLLMGSGALTALRLFFQ